MFTDEQLASILDHWPAVDVPAREIDRVPQGLSGAFVARVKLHAHSNLRTEFLIGNPCGGNGGWALKAWPAGTSIRRVTTVHNQIRRASRHCSLFAVPELTNPQNDSGRNTTTVYALDRIWELSPWVAGEPLSANATLPTETSQSPNTTEALHLHTAGRAIAEAHEALFDDSAVPASLVPTIQRRWDRLLELDQLLPKVLQDRPTLDTLFQALERQIRPERINSPHDLRLLAESLWSAIETLRVHWHIQFAFIRDSQQPFLRPTVAFPIQTVLRDVHREHIHFDSAAKTVTGIIDYDALGNDSPANDLARYAGEFEWSHSKSVEALAAGYRTVRPFSEREMGFARWLMNVNALGGLANWVVWVVSEQRQFTCSASIIYARISHLIASNCRIC